MKNELRDYKKELMKVLIKAVIGAIIGFGLGAGLDTSAVFMAIVGAGIPFGWRLISMIVPFNLVGFSVGVLIFWVVKLSISAMIGVIALPILVVYYIIRIVMENKKSVTVS